MPNAIPLAQQFVPLLDETYQLASLTADLDGNADLVRQGANANELIIPMLSMQGLGDYSRNDGYVKGDVTLTNETVKCNFDRGRMFTVDTMDNLETAGIAFGQLAGEFIRTKVAPEEDAFRFAQYAGKTGISKVAAGASLADGAAVIAALRAAITKMDEDEVPANERYLYITPLLLGYVLSTVSVVGMFKFYAIVTFIVPILALFLPLFDTTCAFFRRLLHGQSPMHPDRGHLHHRLIDMGLSQKQAVAILYSISAILGLCAVVLATSGTVRLYLVVIAAASAVAVGIFIKRTLKGHKYHPPVDPTTCEPLEDKDVKA